MMYADDTQLYLLLSPTELSTITRRLELCVLDVKSWAVKNKLKFNDDKSEVIHFTSRFSSSSNLLSDITIGDVCITPANSVKNLGVILDNKLQMSTHAANICRAGWFGIYKIGKLRNFLDNCSTERLVHAFVTSRIDCCNSLLFGLSEAEITKLQRLQNAAARLVTRSSKYDHVSQILFKLHWLPVKQRIEFKILLLVYKSLTHLGPTYLSELLQPYTPARVLRSSSKNLLAHPKPSPHTATYGQRAFVAAAPTLWNNLHICVRNAKTVKQFKSMLKTHLF